MPATRLTTTDLAAIVREVDLRTGRDRAAAHVATTLAHVATTLARETMRRTRSYPEAYDAAGGDLTAMDARA